MITCKNCGGNFEKEYSYCPYCGYVNELSVKKHYENEMKSISKDLEELPEETKELYEKAAKKEVNKIFRIIAVIGAVILGLFILFGLFTLSLEEDPEDMEAQLQWEREYFPYLDELYEKKEYDKILQFMDEHYLDKGQCYYLWENYEFIELYERYRVCIEQKEKINKKIEKGRYSLSVLLFDASQLVYYSEINRGHKWEEEQKELLMLWKEEMESFLKTEVGATAQQLQLIDEFINSNGYLSFELCEKIEKETKKGKKLW